MTQTQVSPSRSLEILRLSVPLMLAALSTNLMFFFDRLILSRYSLEAMNATASTSLILFTFTMVGIAIAGMAEVYVGQYHGAQAFHKMGKPVWQMLWFSLMLTFAFVPLAFLLKDWVIVDAFQKEGTSFFFWLMCFGGISAANAALSAFFVGKGETKWITMAVVIANLLNILLDLILVFGWKGIPALGATGAAIATITSQIIQLMFLAFIFLNKRNRTLYGTSDYRFDKKLFQECIKLGFPGALSHSFEIGSWAYLSAFLAMHNIEYVTIQVVGQSMFGLFGFLTEGLQKGIISLASNIIGAQNPQLIQQTGRAAFRLQFIFVLLLSIPLLFYPGRLLSLFLQEASPSILEKARLSLIGVWLYFLLDGLNWILVGFITAAGHTTYTMLANIVTCWMGALIPSFMAVHFFHVPAHLIWMVFLPFYALLHFILLYYNYKYKIIDWHKACLIDSL